MKKVTSALIALAVVLPVSFYGSGLQQRREDSITIGTAEVVLDIVVRDKKGRIVKDLKQADFEVYEDNVRQDISSFRLVLREPAGGSAGATAAGTPATTLAPRKSREPFSGISLIAMVFDNLSPNARGLAHKAALSFVDESLKPDDLATVCAIDLSLHVLQPYTNNAQLLRQAIDRVASKNSYGHQSGAEQVRALEQRSAALGTEVSAATASAGASRSIDSAVGAAVMDQALTDMTARALSTFEALERDQLGYAKTDALLALVASLYNVPGRKAIVFFSEGLPLPPNVKDRFREVINAANRANVTIYSVDAAGLRIQSEDAEAAREISALGNRRVRQQASGEADRSGRPMTMQLERNEDLLKLNPHSGLSDLSNETGGFLISHTNDLGAGLRRIDEEMRAHYVLTYTPKNQRMDGRFRQISVRPVRSGLDVQTRKGYLAAPFGIASVLDYEGPVLAAMADPSKPPAFSLRAMAFSFPDSNQRSLAPIIVEVPAASFTYTPSEDKSNFGTDYAIVVLLKDQNNQVIRKASQQYKLTVPAQQIDSVKRSDILFYRQAQLPPGRYVIEAAAYDAPTAKVSTVTSYLDMSRSEDSEVRISSVVILKRAEPLDANDQRQANPFRYGDSLIYPNLGEPVSKKAMKQLPFYFSVYTPPGLTPSAQFTLEVLQNDKPVARSQSSLPAPDSSGRIQYASALPLDSFQPGVYAIRITVSGGKSKVSRAASFTVER